MDIKAKIEEIVKKIKSDKNLLSNFKADPIKTVENLIGVDLPDDIIEKIVEGVKAKITVDDVKGVLGKLKGILGK